MNDVSLLNQFSHKISVKREIIIKVFFNNSNASWTSWKVANDVERAMFQSSVYANCYLFLSKNHDSEKCFERVNNTFLKALTIFFKRIEVF